MRTLLLLALAACADVEAAVELHRPLAPDEVMSPLGTVMKVQNVGLPTGLAASGIPPLGLGVLPSGGRGGDGNFQVTQVGGWSGGAGAIKGYAGQWTIPLPATPGSLLANATCDIFNPSPTIVVTFELVSGLNVISSVPIPSSTTVVIRGWHVPAYRVSDGEQPMLRLNARDSTTGAWATSSQQPTVISCAVNSRSVHTRKLSTVGGTSVGAGGFQVIAGQLSGNWLPVNDGDLLGVTLTMSDGDRFESIRASIYGNTAYTITMSALAQDDAFHVGARLGVESTSQPQNSLQTLTVVPLANDGTSEQVTTGQRSYNLQFRAHVVGVSDGGSLAVGPITLITSN